MHLNIFCCSEIAPSPPCHRPRYLKSSALEWNYLIGSSFSSSRVRMGLWRADCLETGTISINGFPKLMTNESSENTRIKENKFNISWMESLWLDASKWSRPFPLNRCWIVANAYHWCRLLHRKTCPAKTTTGKRRKENCQWRGPHSCFRQMEEPAAMQSSALNAEHTSFDRIWRRWMLAMGKTAMNLSHQPRAHIHTPFAI